MSIEDEAKGLECCSKERLVVIMRRLLLTGISFVLILILSGCTDPYSGKRPYDYGFATWTSENPSAWFAVSPDDELTYVSISC